MKRYKKCHIVDIVLDSEHEYQTTQKAATNDQHSLLNVSFHVVMFSHLVLYSIKQRKMDKAKLALKLWVAITN
ncbi:CLUMA_CG007877, isoform A [Clunio marinus]|uniref:CLUMA_CG007877, isoform A n=1 Tax=Clunio marinus TaxID=568069 RepID=A0A1J1I2C4_9DIPT|nr:CLUMA_CG007877, isoform A [Clunio marinus]